MLGPPEHPPGTDESSRESNGFEKNNNEFGRWKKGCEPGQISALVFQSLLAVLNSDIVYFFPALKQMEKINKK